MRFQKQKAADTAKRQLTTFINSRVGTKYYGQIQELCHQGRTIRQIVGYLTGTGVMKGSV